FDAGGFDAGGFDAGGFDAGGFDAGGFDAGGFDAGGFDAGASRCSASTPCLATGYRFELAPECGVFCYYDEAHNIAINGPGQSQNTAGYDQYASGQLLDGARGNSDWSFNSGSGPGFEWVGWLYRDAAIVFQFPTTNEFSAVRVGLNNQGNGAVYVPSEIRVQFGDDGVTFGSTYFFRRADGSLPPTPLGTRTDVRLVVPGGTGRFIRVTLMNATAWSMVDEVVFE
ncbi:MAG: hypothetical protein Q8K32_03665, partial [Archangium sp.]|nr:hypothetical protein [Archangium sp.]